MEITKNHFVISYLFEAHIDKVFAMWIDPNLFSRWLGPEGAIMTFISSDVKEGGSSHWSMITLDGLKKYGKINYKTIIQNKLLVYTQYFCDEDGSLIKAPFSETYPDYLVTTVNFSTKDNKTEVIVTWDIYGEATKKEYQTFQEMKEIMKTGWTASFHKLESMLK